MRHISSVVRNRDESSTREGLTSGKRERRKVTCKVKKKNDKNERRESILSVSRNSPAISPGEPFNQEISTQPNRKLLVLQVRKRKRKGNGSRRFPLFFYFSFSSFSTFLSLFTSSSSFSLSFSLSRPIFLDRSTGNILESTAR